MGEVLSTFVMSDIHGCYDEFMTMLDKINFSDSDSLILAGDYIDRGEQSFEMLKWIENCPKNVTLLRGNHEEKFSEYAELMLMLDRDEALGTVLNSNADTSALYDSVLYFLDRNSAGYMEFDYYGTVNTLINGYKATLYDLCKWSDIFQKMPYFKKLDINGRTCVVVHAGYTEEFDKGKDGFESVEEFYLYARGRGLSGGIRRGMVIAGHTPTIAQKKFAYNSGNVFRHYDEQKDCIFYDIDCGCVFKSKNSDAKLACIRLEDEEIFYV